MPLDPLESLSELQRCNVNYISNLYKSLCDWTDSPTRLIMTSFYEDHGDNTVIVPQEIYWPPQDEWPVTSNEEIDWLFNCFREISITFRAEGKFGVSIKDALKGTSKVTLKVLDNKTQISPYFSHFSLKILFPGYSPCSMPVYGQPAFRPDGKIDPTKLAQLVAEKISVFVEDRPQSHFDEYDPWNLANADLEDIFLLQLHYVSPRDGWQPVLGMRWKCESFGAPGRAVPLSG
ncbi:hypothetical protein BDY19DRAFT_994896 [Irpex rosettiformis]|uniref:Uncharacterized protein n=1 Tax=Irpex rosettiformis TaxID=378272 RepID=A0ACB8U049_9APHY|nr:hypothetical protein BDY19DRAFT_994896 [Irpex rosettiformis]